MENTASVNWQSFKEILLKNPELDLQFQYGEHERVAPSYHITEIKQAPITSVDCGGFVDRWTEVIIQLWEPGGKQQEHAMKVKKALSIFDLIETKLHLDSKAVVKIEFGNSNFETRHMYPGEFITDEEKLIINLIAERTQCKALGRGDNCGTSATAVACCDDQGEKNLIQLKTLVHNPVCCMPASGCC